MSSAEGTSPHVRKYPFVHMSLADHTQLNTIEKRSLCYRCNRSRKFFCYTCYIPVGDVAKIIPQVDIPIQIDIIKHKKEIDGKSTAIHAAILAPEKVSIHTFPDIPDFQNSKEDGVVLIFPSATSLTVPQLFGRKVRLINDQDFVKPKGYNMGTMLRCRRKEEVLDNDDETGKRIYSFENLPIKRAVFIDSTWNQSVGIYKDNRIKSLPKVVLQNRMSQFWRHQRNSPRWYLATIEAIHQFLVEVHLNAWGLNPNYRGFDNLEISAEFLNAANIVEAASNDVDRESAYNGQYDNLMYFFANMYDLIHKYYDHNELKSYRRPI